MGRKPQVRYYASRKGGGYFCTIRGQLHELALGKDDSPEGPTYLAAVARYLFLLGLSQAESKGEENTVRVVCERYMQHIGSRRKPTTVRFRLRYLRPFLDWQSGDSLAGDCAVCRLTHALVYRFLERMAEPGRMVGCKGRVNGRPIAPWNEGGQRNFLQSLAAALNWSVRAGLIPRNPLDGIEKPGASSRGAESLIGCNSEEIEVNHARILACVRKGFRPFIQALKDTGARPGEIAAATAADFDAPLGAFVFRKEATRRTDGFSHKTARKEKDRVVMLAGSTLELVRELAGRQSSGPLFRRYRGKVFTQKCWCGLFEEIRKRLSWDGLTAYSYRHTFATEMLKAGMDVDILAHLMGNTPVVIRSHYSHLLADKQGLREKLERFRKAAGGS